MEAIKNIVDERILFSPLNWGWGHVSRSIPVLRELQKQKNEIVIACSKEQQEIYTQYLADIVFVRLKGYPFEFKGRGNFAIDLLLSLRNLRNFGRIESDFVTKQLKALDITLVLSDHRYYFRNEQVPSIFITHQINLPLPWYLKFVQFFHLRLIKKFNAVWIIDDDDLNIAGKLSLISPNSKLQALKLGMCSRLSSADLPEKKNWITVLVSGPEPYANQFYQDQKSKMDGFESHFCIIYHGVLEDAQGKRDVSWLEIDERLKSTKKLIARSGYSTIMDAHFLACETEWHPTPGQWEQEYLAMK